MQNSINCTVESCKHNGSGKSCSLGNVSVGATSMLEPKAEKDTQCGSFECC